MKGSRSDMLSNPIEEMRLDNAKFVRNTEYVKETSIDDVIDERLEVAESQYTRETMSELQEAADMLTKMSSEDNVKTESEELERILNASENLTFNEMVGIE